MSVLGWVEDFKGRKGSGKISLSPQKFVRTYTRHFIVRTSSVLDGPLTVLLAAGLPQRYEWYVSGNDIDLAAFCIEGTATPRSDHPTVWDAVFEYTTDIPTPDQPNDPNNPANPNNPASDPTKRGTRYGMSYVTISKVLEKDAVTGIGVTNSAGEKFDPPLEREIYLTVLTCQRNEARLFVTLAQGNLSGYVNQNDFTIRGNKIVAGTALARVRQTQIFESGVVNGAGKPASYFDTTYEFTINPDGWAIAPLDQGSRKRVPGKPGEQIYQGDSKPVAITDAFGQPLNHLVNLDGFGRQAGPLDPPVYLDGTHKFPGNGQTFDNGPFHSYPQTPFPASF